MKQDILRTASLVILCFVVYKIATRQSELEKKFKSLLDSFDDTPEVESTQNVV